MNLTKTTLEFISSESDPHSVAAYINAFIHIYRLIGNIICNLSVLVVRFLTVRR
jgi:hypothetical protein